MKRLLSISLVALMVCFLLASCGESKSKNVLTLTKYEQVQNGMTYEEVVEIIGFEGTVTAEGGEKGTDLYTVSYSLVATK